MIAIPIILGYTLGSFLTIFLWSLTDTNRDYVGDGDGQFVIIFASLVGWYILFPLILGLITVRWASGERITR